METPRAPALNPALLPPGTLVGSWLVVAWAGRGVHGAVYQAVPVDNPHATPVALKLALLPRDPRFAREVELLSCVRHPSVPRLWDHGEWQHPGGTLYPFLVMDWVDGAPLYDWARQHNPSSQQVLRLLAQLASALQALHAQSCVHRDVKGGNVLVRHADSRALLTDFGSGRYPDAATLTPDILPPGTPAYRSPEAWLFELQFFRDPQARYAAQPTDDLYSLGVTAYQLVTGQYPELGEPSQDEAGTWHLEGLASPTPIVLNPRVAPQLDALILRMLSVRPEARGTAHELTEALEQAAQLASPESTRSLFAQDTRPAGAPAEQTAGATVPATLSSSHELAEVRAQAPEVSSRTPNSAERVRPPARARPWRRRLAKAAALLALGTWVWWITPKRFPEQPSAIRHAADGTHQRDGGTSGLGDEAATASTMASPSSSVPGVRAEDTPPEPLPGQARPDTKGRCAHKRQISLNGGCWVAVPLDREGCAALKLSGHMFKGACYVPVILHGRQPTSDPVRKQ
ncbi:MAG: serine/threonine protein kinase [Myxococcaceae bacterium]|nr:serine/threonine protein kinase [Myxococcaceae bacterium]